MSRLILTLILVFLSLNNFFGQNIKISKDILKSKEDICTLLKNTYNDFKMNRNNLEKDSIFASLLERSFYKKKYINSDNKEYQRALIFDCENDDDEIWITQLKHMKSMKAKRLFASPLFRSILDGELAETYREQSIEAEYFLYNPDKLLELKFTPDSRFEKLYNEEKPYFEDVICLETKIKATSTLNSYKDINYIPENLNDFNINSSWVEGKDDCGIGEKIFINFDDGCFVDGIILSNGYAKNEQVWNQNSRVKSLYVKINNKIKYKLELLDIYGFQSVSFAPNSISFSGRIVLEIVDIYPGSKYKDTAISELYFLYQP